MTISLPNLPCATGNAVRPLTRCALQPDPPVGLALADSAVDLSARLVRPAPDQIAVSVDAPVAQERPADPRTLDRGELERRDRAALEPVSTLSATIPEFRVADRVFVNLEASVDQDDITVPYDGAIGRPLLARFRLAFDFRNSRVAFEPYEQPDGR